MRTLNVEEIRQVEGGLTTNCPVCGKRITVSWFYMLFFGRAAAIRIDREQAASKHLRGGWYNRSSSVHY